MEFGEIVKGRYATKNFDGRKIPDEEIGRLIDLIRLAPSSFNIQPWKVIVITDENTKNELSAASWNQPQIKSCSHLLVFCADTDISGNIAKLGKLMADNGTKPEAMKTYVDMMNGFEKKLSEDEKLSWAQRQAFLALGNALNGAKSLGLDSCPMEGFDPKAYSKILRLPDNIVPTALCPVGYASDKQNQKLRFSKDDMFLFK